MPTGGAWHSFNYHNAREPDKAKQPPEYKRPLWVIGILSTVLRGLGRIVVSEIEAPIPVVNPV